MTARRFWNPRARSHHERGFILVWFTVMLVVLLAIGGLAVDLGRWYVESQRTQRAADAAAMAGVVHRSPAEDFSADPRWSSVAATVAEANGYSNNVSPGTPLSDTGDVRVEASTRSCTGPGNDEDCVELPRNQLKVTVETRIPNLFATLVGLDTHNVRRSAIAEYQGEVQMGSPTNVLGNEPVAAGETRWTNGDPAQQPGFWLNVNGPRTYLANGEPYQGNDCRVVAFPEGVGPDRADGCDGTGQNRFYEYPTDVLGGESGRDGYLYTIRARGTQPGETLRVQLFDPVWTPQGSACTSWQYSDIYNHVVAYKDASPVSGWPGVLPSPRELKKYEYRWELVTGYSNGWNILQWIPNLLPDGLTLAEADAVIDGLLAEDQERYRNGNTDFCSGDDALNGTDGCPDVYLLACAVGGILVGLVGLFLAPVIPVLPGLPFIPGFGGSDGTTPAIGPPGSFEPGGDRPALAPLAPAEPAAGLALNASSAGLGAARPADDFPAPGSGVFTWFPQTVFRLYAPDGPDGTFAGHTLLCTRTADWFGTNDWKVANTTNNLLTPDTFWFLYARNETGFGDVGFRDGFRRWLDFCSVPAQDGDYILRVTTNEWFNTQWSNPSWGWPFAPRPNKPLGAGANRFSIRAGLTGPGGNSRVSVFAEAKLGIYANLAGNSSDPLTCTMGGATCTRFYLARVFPGGANRILELAFYDPGDLVVCQSIDPVEGCDYPPMDGSAAGQLTIAPPAEATDALGLPLTSWGCTYQFEGGPTFNPATCTIGGLDMNQNGRLLEVEIALPADFQCDYNSPGGCWVRAVFEFPETVADPETPNVLPRDNTTWSATLLGDPVRLVE